MIHLHLIEGFLLGIIATSSLAAALFFLRFWRGTGDSLFLYFSAAFFIEGLNRIAIMFFPSPSEASPWVYLVRCFAFLLIIAGIVNKNRHSST